jgi:cell division protein FtsN
LIKKETELQSMFIKNILVNTDKCKDSSMTYKVFIGPFASILDATKCQKDLKKKNVTGFIVDLTTLK